MFALFVAPDVGQARSTIDDVGQAHSTIDDVGLPLDHGVVGRGLGPSVNYRMYPT